jgi:hypothetical protein
MDDDTQKIATQHLESWHQLAHHPGWVRYARALDQKRAELMREQQAAVRQGNFARAMLKQVAFDVIGDCLDLPKLEAANLELTLSIGEDVESLLERERAR